MNPGEYLHGPARPLRLLVLLLPLVLGPTTARAETGSWETKADLPLRVQEVYPALHRGRIYLAGGLSPDAPATALNISDRVFVYDPAADRWQEGPALPEPRHHPYLVSTGERLYSFGGFVAADGERWHASTDILQLDEDAGRWIRVGELIHPQSETVAAYIDGRIYLASGRMPTGSANARWTDQGDIDRVQVFDPATGEVTTGPAAPSARNSAAGAVIDGRLYLVGGRVVGNGNRRATEMFDPTTGSWHSLAPMPNAQGGLAAAALDGRLYVFGGEYFENGGGVHAESWVYDPATDAWSALTPMPVPRHGLGAVTVGNSIFVIAGAAQVGGSETTARLSLFRPQQEAGGP